MVKSAPNTFDSQLLAQQAIQAAICANWQQAAKINQKILSFTKDDVEALNRLAMAQNCLGNIAEAQKLYKKVLSIDPYNIIAQKNLDKISKFTSTKPNGGNTVPSNGNDHNLSKLFLFEPGKTKVINLLNLAPPQILASLHCGEQIIINPKNHAVTITTQEGTYLGALPDDLAHRLIAFIAGGNQYEACVKCSSPKTLTIFIREVFRSPKFASQPSFQCNPNNYFDTDSF